MEEQSEIVRSKKEFAFASSTILSQVGRGIIVGLIVGIIVGSFRFLIEKGFHLIQGVYQDQGYLVRIFLYWFCFIYSSVGSVPN
ncbi:voltage-gated chloride channel family protein [Streptococcus pneumoniae]|nr:voltage-gated chloride channel family protein [Streptococcus pneumoniae]